MNLETIQPLASSQFLCTGTLAAAAAAVTGKACYFQKHVHESEDERDPEEYDVRVAAR